MDRPKRVIMKLSRYETTSSDESPTKRRRSTTVATIGSGTIDEDIEDINRMLDENSTTLYNNTHMAHPHTTQHTSQRTHANIQAHTNISYIGYIPEIQTNTTHAHTSPIIHQHPHNTPTQSFTLTTSANKSYYSNNILPEFQESTRSRPMQEQDTCRDKNTHRENIGYGVGYSQETTQKITEKRKEEDRFDRVEAEMKRMNGLLQKILKCVQDRHSTPQKPAELPISSLQQMDAFENIDDNGYSNVVNYFQYVGGFHLKGAVNLCLKEALTDAFTRSFTWWGREEGHRPLYNARLTLAIHEAVCRNRHFQKPTRSEFQVQMREALRVAKERHRSRMRGPRTRTGEAGLRINRDLWSDERIEGEDEETNIPGTIND